MQFSVLVGEGKRRGSEGGKRKGEREPHVAGLGGDRSRVEGALSDLLLELYGPEETERGRRHDERLCVISCCDCS